MVAQLTDQANHWRKELGDSLQGISGSAIRPLAKIQAEDRLLIQD
jgi:hypothetical protein